MHVPIDMVQLGASDQPPPPFVITDWLPEGSVTLMAAHGEGGKSQVALYLAISLAAGLPVLGHPAQPARRVLVYSCEDRAPALRWRIQQYCAALEIAPGTLDGWLFVIDASEQAAPELFVEARGTPGKTTPAYDDLQQFMARHEIDVVVIDNASDVYAANEIHRPSVRAFIRALQRLLPRNDRGAVLLLGHVNRNASANNQNGQQYSGSTAWHNSVRSRWELTRGKVDDEDDDGEQGAPAAAPYILRRAKANYAGGEGASQKFHWNHLHRVILPDVALGPVLHAIEQRNHEREVLAAFVEAEKTGQRISPNVRANNNAAKVFKDMGLELPQRLRAMNSLSPVLSGLRRKGKLAIETYTYDGKERQRWMLTEQGRVEGTR